MNETLPLQTVIDGLPREVRLPFLREAYRPDRPEVGEALLTELHPNQTEQTRGEYNAIIKALISGAEADGNPERVKELKFKQITSYFHPEDIQRAAIASGDPNLIQRVIEHYRSDYLFKGMMVMNLLEHLDKGEEVKAYGLEAAQALRRLPYGGSNIYDSSKLYMRLGMVSEAIEVFLEKGNFDDAIKLAQKHLSGDTLITFYRRVYDAVAGRGYEHGFPIQLRVAKELLKDEELVRQTLEAYLDWQSANDKDGIPSLYLIRKVGGRPALLQAAHRRNVDFYQDELSMGRRSRDDFLKVVAEAYQDTQDVQYAKLALACYEKDGNFPQALEFARIVGDTKKVEILESALRYMQQ